MAITIENQPNYPNASHVPLMYGVLSDNVLNPQFQYVCDIYEQGGSVPLTRLTQYPNPLLRGVFNMSRIFNDYIDYTSDEIVISSPVSSSHQKVFEVKFGEQFGASPSSSVAVFNGVNDQVGDPALTGSLARVFAGTMTTRTSAGINFPTGSFTGANTKLSARTGPTPYLDYGIQATAEQGVMRYGLPVDDRAFETISFLQNNGQFINNVTVRVYNGEATSYTEYDFGVDPQTGKNGVVMTIPTGPANFGARGDALGTKFQGGDWSYYIVILKQNLATVYTQFYSRPGGIPGGPRKGQVQPPDLFQEGYGCFDTVRFAYINRFGVWDYASIALPRNETVNITKRITENIDYLGWSEQGLWDPAAGGNTQYNTNYEDSFTVSTPYLYTNGYGNKPEGFYDLLESPLVLAQFPTADPTDINAYSPYNLFAVVITNGTYDRATNLRNQQQLQYTFNVTFANDRPSR